MGNFPQRRSLIDPAVSSG